MSKKGKKKGTSFSNSHSVSSKNESIVTEDKTTNQSLNYKRVEMPHQFIVLLDYKNTYTKLLKSAHVILLHPTVIKSFNAPRFVLVKGKNSQSLCIAYHLKDIKLSTVVFRNGIKDFQHEELVTLQPYTKSVLEAANVTVNFNSPITIDEDLKEQVLEILKSKKYFYSGMTIKQRYFDFTITNILCKESDSIYRTESFDTSEFKNYSSNFLNSTAMSLNETKDKKLLATSAHDRSRSRQSSSQLHSMFSSMCLNDNELQDSKHSEYCAKGIVSDMELNSEECAPLFYTLSYATSLSVLGHTFRIKTPLPSFDQIGGLKNELQRVRNFLDEFLASESKFCNILLLVGPPGTGKTLTLSAIRNEYHVHIEEIFWHKLCLMTSSNAEQELQRVFQRAKEKALSIIFADNFNYLCPKAKDMQSPHISRMVAHSIASCVGSKIIIVAASNNSEYDAEVLKTEESKIEEIKFRIPTSEEREDVFKKLLSTRQHLLSSEDIKQCIMHSQGFTGRDLNCVLNDAMAFLYLRAQENKSVMKDSSYDTIIFEDIKQALKYKKPSIVESDMKIKKVLWSDIGGMKDVKEKLKDIIEIPLKYPDIYKRFSITPSRGVLLFGPPGCSKTMIAKALATECDLNFISKNISDIQNKYVGESEKAVRNLFLLAREKAPCIIFLDEIDALVAGRGSSSGSGVEERIVNSFLQEMDGLEELQNVVIIAATNRPDRLDAAFVRSGRINHFIYIPLPDINTREEILKLQMKNRKVADDFDYKYLALKTEGYSGAEIVNVCNEAAFQILAEDIECKSAVFTLKHFENAMKFIIPRTPKELLDFYENYNAKLGSQ